VDIDGRNSDFLGAWNVTVKRLFEGDVKMLKVVGFNGSGRKTWNTAELCRRFLDGARSAGATTELVHLSDLQYRGCQGCLTCKLVGTTHDGRCVVQDDLTKYLESVPSYSVLAFATPIFFYGESAMMRCLLERLMFQYLDYHVVPSKFRGNTKIAYLASMNISTEWLARLRAGPDGFPPETTQSVLKRIFGNCERVYACDTLQVDDYAKYHITVFNEAKKKKHREEQFGKDLDAAFALGAALVSQAKARQ
jgi:multimeric flavodoxin WrbA